MKKVMFIAPKYFDYYKIIIDELKINDFDVDWFDDRPTDNILKKSLLRIFPFLFRRTIKKYFDNIILNSATKTKYEYVFVILGQTFTKKMIDKLHEVLPDAKFILYLWDSLDNFPLIKCAINAYDVVYSFDSYDCNKYNFAFLPLFYNSDDVNDFELATYDVCYIGTIKKGKMKYLNEIIPQLNKKYSNNYFYLYLQSKLVYLFYKITSREFKKNKISNFHFKTKSYEENIEISKKSKIVLDVPMSKQNGLTMRTFECLAYKRKLITTNKTIVNYDFYRPENIYVYDGRFDFDNIFFKSDYVELENNIVEKYSLKKWISTIFELDGGSK